MLNAFYEDSIGVFLNKSIEEIIGEISLSNKFDINSNTVESWKQQIEILKTQLLNFEGEIYFEFSIPSIYFSSCKFPVIMYAVFNATQFSVSNEKHGKS